MRMDKCMNFIAENSRIENPIGDYMKQTFKRISTNMMDELLSDMLNDYADLLKIVFKIIPVDHNKHVNVDSISLFNGIPRMIDGQVVVYQQYAFIFYDVQQQLFKPIFIYCADGSKKTCFNDNEYEKICKDICEFINEQNLHSKS